MEKKQPGTSEGSKPNKGKADPSERKSRRSKKPDVAEEDANPPKKRRVKK